MNVKVRQAFNRLEVILHFMSDRMSINNLRAIQQALEQAEENEKALKIIVDRNIRTGILKKCKNNNSYYSRTGQMLSQAEFDLVKKVVEKYGQ